MSRQDQMRKEVAKIMVERNVALVNIRGKLKKVYDPAVTDYDRDYSIMDDLKCLAESALPANSETAQKIQISLSQLSDSIDEAIANYPNPADLNALARERIGEE